MNNHGLWNLTRETGSAIAAHYRPVIEELAEKSELDGRSLSLLLAVLTLEPDNTTPSHLLVRDPYSSAELFFARLASAARSGFLGEVAPGEFRLTPEGRALVQRFVEEARQAMVDADPLAAKESRRLAELLRKLVNQSLDAPPPPNRWSIGLSYKLMPPMDPPLPYTEQCISCMAAYRDDAHLAAWRGTGLSATALETLTLIWRDQRASLTELARLLSHRGHAPQVYVDAVDELEKLGYLQGLDDNLALTEKGQKFRDRVEADTDKYFFSPWGCFTEGERNELERLLSRARDGLLTKIPEIENSS